MRSGLLALAILLWSGLLCGREPALWDTAKNSRRATDLAAYRRAEAAYYRDKHLRGRHMAALDALAGIDAATSPEPRVRFFYGRMLSYVGFDARAVVVLEDAIKFAPKHPCVADALFALAVCYARLGLTEKEMATYERWLGLEWDPRSRAIGLVNMAEGLMHAGRIEESVVRYREAMANDYGTGAAHWGLAVALDRAGDPNGAIAAAVTALALDPEMNDVVGPNTFFVPSYDKYWYLALGAMASVKTAQSQLTEIALWNSAQLYWQQYVDAAAAGDRWLPIARIRLMQCTRTVEELDKRSGRKR